MFVFQIDVIFVHVPRFLCVEMEIVDINLTPRVIDFLLLKKSPRSSNYSCLATFSDFPFYAQIYIIDQHLQTKNPSSSISCRLGNGRAKLIDSVCSDRHLNLALPPAQT